MADADEDGQEQGVALDHIGNHLTNEDNDAEIIQGEDNADRLEVQDNDMVAHGSNMVQVYPNGGHYNVGNDANGGGGTEGLFGDSTNSTDFLMEIEQLMNEDAQKTCLNKLFAGFTNNQYILNHITLFLDYKSKLAFREVSKMCNAQVIRHPAFIKKTRITMGKKWYRDAIGLNNLGISMKFSELKLERFTYHGKSALLKNFCHNIRPTLTKLIITHCSLEYNGFSYFLNTMDYLDTLVICDVRLQAPRSAPKPDDDKKERVYAKPLRSLTLEKIYLLNSWATSLLVRRTGRLETLILKDLFIKDEKLVKLIEEERKVIREEHEKAKRNRRHTDQQSKKIPRETKDPEKTNEGTAAFFRRLPYLLEANKESLKKLVLEESADTDLEIVHRFFQVVQENDIKLNLNEFCLTYRPLKCLAPHVVKFCADCCKNLEVFKLKVVGPCANDLFADILGTDLGKTVRQLVLDFDSNNFVSESLFLGALEGFEKLESFKLIDSKGISKTDSIEYNKIYRRAHPKIQPEPRPDRPRRQNRAQNNQQNGNQNQVPPPPEQPEHGQTERTALALNELQTMDQKLGTKCTFNFTQYLKPELKELSINNFITNIGDNVVNIFAQVHGTQVLENLTKLELRRSTKMFLKSSPELMVLISTLTKLKSLTLAKMHLNDYDLTGMDLQHCKRLRSTMTHQSILLFTPGQENEVVDDEVAKAEFMNYMNGPQFTKVFANLKDLRRLDISGNLKVTDLSLIELAKIPKLKFLNLADNNKITDPGLHYISQNLPILEEINLRNLRRISEYGMNKLLFGCTKLHSIYTTSIMKNQANKESLEYELSKDYDQVLKTPWGENKIKILDETDEQSDADEGGNDENEHGDHDGANEDNENEAGANEGNAGAGDGDHE